MEEETPRTLISGSISLFLSVCLLWFNCFNLPMRGCADAGGMEEVTLFKRKVSDRSTVTPREGKGKVLKALPKKNKQISDATKKKKKKKK